MQTQEYTNTDISSKRDGDLKAIFYLLQSNLDKIQGEVNNSYELLKIGEKTKLTETIEAALKDPFSNLSEISREIDQQIKNMLNMLVSSFFYFMKEYVHSAYINKTLGTDITYCIVLKEDNFENRDKMFDFFEEYDKFELSLRYRIFFQFVPIELETKITASEKLQFN